VLERLQQALACTGGEVRKVGLDDTIGNFETALALSRGNGGLAVSQTISAMAGSGSEVHRSARRRIVNPVACSRRKGRAVALEPSAKGRPARPAAQLAVPEPGSGRVLPQLRGDTREEAVGHDLNPASPARASRNPSGLQAAAPGTAGTRRIDAIPFRTGGVS
jgi:hypothetical protein